MIQRSWRTTRWETAPLSDPEKAKGREPGQGGGRLGRAPEVGDVDGGYVLPGQTVGHQAGLLAAVVVQLGVALAVYQGKRCFGAGRLRLPVPDQEDLGRPRGAGEAQ